MIRTVLFTSTLAAAAFAAAATPALARDTIDPAIEPTHVTVAFADLDLNSTAGQAQLHRRITHAAASACADAGDGLAPARALREVTTCRSVAMRDAETELAARGLDMHLAMH